MKISTRLLILLILTLTFFGLFCYIAYFWSNRLISDFDVIPSSVQTIQHASDLENLTENIQYHDEILTQSVRNYASTGDVQWKSRYQQYASKLDGEINQLLKNQNTDSSIFSSIDQNYHALIVIEQDAIAKVDDGKKDQALLLLQSDPYLQKKVAYQADLDKSVKSRGKNYLDTLSNSTTYLTEATTSAQTALVYYRLIIMIMFGFTIIIALFIFSLLRVFILRPLNEVRQATENIASGDLGYQIKYQSHDEIGELAHSANQMARQLKESYTNIEEKVEAQTEQIREKSQDLEKERDTVKAILQEVKQEKLIVTQERDKSQAIIKNIGDGVIVVDKNEKIILINPQAATMLGYRETELLGHQLSHLIPIFYKNGQKIPDEARPITNVLKKGKILTLIDHSYQRKDQSILPIALTITPVHLEKKLNGAIEIFRDITLEREIDKAKTEFVSLASHQLKTPLTAINWFTEKLIAGDAGKLTKNQVRYFDEIYHGSQRMVRLVTALLNVSRLELGTFAINPEPTHLIDLAKEAIKELKLPISNKKIKLKEKYARALPKINLDPRLMSIIFQNLLSNAVKYSPDQGQVELTIAKNSRQIIITVKDNGCGIPANQQKQIFTKLFRADNVLEMETEGTGLGLYLVKSILDKSGGKISFQSIQNQGSTFVVELPISGMKPKIGSKSLEKPFTS